MELLYKGSKTIILFLIIMLVMQTAFGDKIAQKSSVMILFSILILQSDKVSEYFSAVTTDLVSNKKTLDTMTQGTIVNNDSGKSSTHTSSAGVSHGGGGTSF